MTAYPPRVMAVVCILMEAEARTHRKMVGHLRMNRSLAMKIGLPKIPSKSTIWRAYTAGTKFEIGSLRDCSHVLRASAPADVMCWQWRLVQSSCRLAGRFFKYSGPSRSGTCPVPDGIAGWRAACASCPLHGSRSCRARRRALDGCCQHCFWQPEGTEGGVEPPLACAGAAKRPRTEVPGVTPGTRRYALSSASSA